VMAFSKEQIRALVEAAQYTAQDAREWMITCLLERRDKVGREYFSRVLPLDSFTVRDGRLRWEHLGARYDFFPEPEIRVSWARFDNMAESQTPIEAVGPALPAAATGGRDGEYFAARLVGDDEAKTVTVYLRKRAGEFDVVGIDRTW
jgi:hypothetical protein